MDHLRLERSYAKPAPNPMSFPDSTPPREGRWTSLWAVAFASLLGQLALCQFFSFGRDVPLTIDMNPSNLWKLAYHFPPNALFLVLNWFGSPNLPTALTPFSLAALWPSWLFFTSFAPLMGTCSLLAMAAFLRELELPRPAALFGGVMFAWQGDLLPFVFPGHFAYITSWPFFAIAAWGALRAQRTGHWAYAVISGASCGTMMELPTATDRGAIASLLIAAFYLAPVIFSQPGARAVTQFVHLVICAGTALLISLASLMALFQIQISGVKMGGHTHFEEVYNFCTQFSLGPWESFTYLVPGFFGWHTNSNVGPYWGWIGEWPGWDANHEGMRNLNLAISTTGTAAVVLALIGACILLPGSLLGPGRMSARTQFYSRLLLALGVIALVFSWGYHTSLYRSLFVLPLMDKWRNPLKWLEITNFAAITLSAVGLQHLLTSLSTNWPAHQIIRNRVGWLSGTMLVLLIFGLLGSYLFDVFLSVQLQSENYDPAAVDNIRKTLHTSLEMACLIMALFCLLLWGIWRPEKLRTWTMVNPLMDRLWRAMLQPEHLGLTLAVGMAVISVIQLAWVDTHFIQPAQFSAIVSSNPLLDTLKSEGDQVRVSVAVEDPVLNILLLNQFNALNISSVDISAASRIPDDINAFFNALGRDRQRLWFLAGVKNVAVPQEFMPQLHSDPILAANIDHADGYTLTPTGSPNLPSHALLGMKDYLSKATLVPKAEFISSGPDMLKRIVDRSWNPRESVLLDLAQAQLTPPTESDRQASSVNWVKLETYTPTEIIANVQSSKGGFLLINDQYDPDWQVQVDGRPAQLWRANYLMRAVEVPPGESRVTMQYVAHYHVAGFNLPVTAMNLFSDAAMIAAWLIAALALRPARS